MIGLASELTGIFRLMDRKTPHSLILLSLILLTISGPFVIAGFLLGGRMIGSILTLGIILVYVSLYIYAMRRHG